MRAMRPSIAIGAPGIYRYSPPEARTSANVRMDVCAFVGVAPRGPALEPVLNRPWTGGAPLILGASMPARRSRAVPVESWDAYLRQYGGFEGPGRLPYAVASFFEQGGTKAYVVRIVHTPENAAYPDGVAVSSAFPTAKTSAGILRLRARNEGSWGNGLWATLGFSATPVQLLPGSTTDELIVDAEEPLTEWALLRLNLPETQVKPAERQLRFVTTLRKEGPEAAAASVLRVTLSSSVHIKPTGAEIIEGDLIISDSRPWVERFEGLGLSFRHPRWMAAVLFNESQLVYPDFSWANSTVEPLDPDAPPVVPSADSLESVVRFKGGKDRYDEIILDDFFDTRWTLGDPDPGNGIAALSHILDLSTVVVPDLYVPEPLPKSEAPPKVTSLVGARFETCVSDAAETVEADFAMPELVKLHLDPQNSDDLLEITAQQEKLSAFADKLRHFVVLLDVPPGLSGKKILKWRSRFRSSYVAAYFPWLMVSQSGDQRDQLIRLNPSAVAAGIIAKQEHLFGVPHGPANCIAQGVVKVDERISPTAHDALHPQGINIFLQEPDGVWLSAGRTLSWDTRFRQLSIRRLLMMIHRMLQQQMQWAVFEPNSPALWTEVRHHVTSFLRRLHAMGAFKGASEAQAFFVRCDEQLNTRRITDAGQMLAQVGVAPAEPLEFILVRITRGADGTLIVES